MKTPLALFGAALALLASVAARSATGDRVLVVLEPSIDRADYSKFWDSLDSRGFGLTFKSPEDKSAELIKFGEAQYDHLIVFAPSTKSFAQSLSPQALVDAQLAGINTLFLLSPELSQIQRETFREYDLEFVEQDSVLLDAFSHVASSPLSTVLLPPSTLVEHGAILSPSTVSAGPIVYPSGTVHSVGRNPLLVNVLHGSKTGYVGEERLLSADEAEVESVVGNKDVKLAGKKAGLVSALQTRDNVRVGFVGSGAMFSNQWWDTRVKTEDGESVSTANAAFAEDFTKWIFQETGVVKIVSTHHHRADEAEPRELYVHNDELVYTLTLAQHTTTKDGESAWTGFSADDIQLEFIMLDPYIRTALVKDPASSTSTATTYKAEFKAPDRHGVFKFVVEYWRPGWSWIQSSETVSVTPPRHDQYPRFVVGAWPFYASAFSVSIAFLLFATIWLAISAEEKKPKKKSE